MNLLGKAKQLFAPTAVNAPQRRGSPGHAGVFQLYHPASGRSWWLKPGENTIGRSLDNDIILRDESVSRRHARIFVDGFTVYIEDVGSVNGTYLAGEQIKSAALPRDVLFTLGTVQLTVRKPSLTESAAGPWPVTRD